MCCLFLGTIVAQKCFIVATENRLRKRPDQKQINKGKKEYRQETIMSLKTDSLDAF